MAFIKVSPHSISEWTPHVGGGSSGHWRAVAALSCWEDVTATLPRAARSYSGCGEQSVWRRLFIKAFTQLAVGAWDCSADSFPVVDWVSLIQHGSRVPPSRREGERSVYTF